MPTNTPPKPVMPASASPVSGKVLLGLAGLAVGFLVGYGAGRVSTGTPVNPLLPAENRGGAPAPGAAPSPTQAGFLPPALEESSSISGTVVSVTESRLTFDADLAPFDPLGEKDLPKRRTAEITADTRIVRLVEKTPQEMSADQQAFADAAAEASAEAPPSPPPLPYREVSIAATDISAGEMVTVEAASDIVKLETFTATRVVVAPKLSAPPQGAPTPLAPEPVPPPAPEPAQ